MLVERLAVALSLVFFFRRSRSGLAPLTALRSLRLLDCECWRAARRRVDAILSSDVLQLRAGRRKRGRRRLAALPPFPSAPPASLSVAPLLSAAPMPRRNGWLDIGGGGWLQMCRLGAGVGLRDANVLHCLSWLCVCIQTEPLISPLLPPPWQRQRRRCVESLEGSVAQAARRLRASAAGRMHQLRVIDG